MKTRTVKSDSGLTSTAEIILEPPTSLRRSHILVDPETRPGASREPSSQAPSTHPLLDRWAYGGPLPAIRNTAASYFRSLCKTLRINLLYNFITDKFGFETGEDEKVAFYKDRKHAAIHCLGHIIPVVPALTLIILNLTQYYIGGELSGKSGQDSQKLGALQFAGKLHELLMLASLGTIVFHYMREELAFGHGLPYGAMFAGQQVDKLSTLWSAEFWSLVYHAKTEVKGRRRRKWFLVILTFVCIILGVSVGASTNNLMRPRLQYWPAGGTTFWINATEQALFPRSLGREQTDSGCLVYTGDAACPYGDYGTILEGQLSYWPWMQPMGALPEQLYTPSRYSMRTMVMRHRTVEDSSSTNLRGLWPDAFTTATVPPAAISDGLSNLGLLWAYAAANSDKDGRRFRFRQDVQYSVDTNQPSVTARCWISKPSNATTLTPLFPDLGSPDPLSTNNLWPAYVEFSTSVNFVDTGVNATEVNDWLVNALYNQTSPSVYWIDDATVLGQSNSSLLAIVAVPQSVLGRKPVYYSCAIGSWLVPVTLLSTRNVPKIINARLPITTDLPTNKNGSFETIYPSAAWAAYTNPYLPAYGMDVLSKAVSAAGLWNSTLHIANYNTEFAIESILTTLLANGISRVSYNTSMAGTLKDMVVPGVTWEGGGWANEFLPNNELGHGGDAYEISPEAQGLATKFTMKAEVYGYAYSSDGLTQQAAIGALLFYCILAIIHMIRIVLRGRTSTSWDSAPEIAAVALNSERTHAMQNAGAGISANKTFEAGVRVRERAGGIEIVFEDNEVGTEAVGVGRQYM